MENSAIAMEEVNENRKRMKLESTKLRKDASLGSLLGNIRGGGGGGGRVVQEEDCDVMVISDDSNHEVTSYNASLAAMLSSESLAKFGLVEETYTVQNGTKSYETKEFSQKYTNIHKPKEKTLDRTSDEHCSDKYKSTNEVVILEASEEDNSRETVNDQDETSLPLPSVQYKFDDPLMALNYMGEFKMPEDNFTKGCKWLVTDSLLIIIDALLTPWKPWQKCLPGYCVHT